MWSKEKRREYDREYSKNNREKINEKNRRLDKERRERNLKEGCFVYCIHSLITGKKYIGSSKNLKERIKGHFKPSHWKNNYPLYDDMKLYGKENFVWGVVEKVEEKDMVEREKYWITELNSIVEGYNKVRPVRTLEEKREQRREYKRRTKYQGQLGN
jgi:group I intron endonuclease